jgi:hypothetical protein
VQPTRTGPSSFEACGRNRLSDKTARGGIRTGKYFGNWSLSEFEDRDNSSLSFSGTHKSISALAIGEFQEHRTQIKKLNKFLIKTTFSARCVPEQVEATNFARPKRRQRSLFAVSGTKPLAWPATALHSCVTSWWLLTECRLLSDERASALMRELSGRSGHWMCSRIASVVTGHRTRTWGRGIATITTVTSTSTARPSQPGKARSEIYHCSSRDDHAPSSPPVATARHDS